ncbi:MAG: hypothetical protein P8X73_01335 [Ignavibacteriaceae bacterium]
MLSYRLKQIDFDGSYEYSDEVLVSKPAPIDFALHQNYKNPFKERTIIKYCVPEEIKINLEILDMKMKK